ncbi:ABC transporter permease [Brachybacterium sacelli]|uniref:Glycine betaine/proline transport system permease protein n=1 Tax=Brachybacterium sacelli TaxID=173364 RepID=A0ABS4X3S5_9MICO|nr:proline/glycine betaine ABC transporter permease [Brachybacterium sacelli]MBP2383115.1 glycine betaine/proline transport system permease protein [Brachybacterium sacelli]
MNPDDESGILPHIPIGDWADEGLSWLKSTFAEFFDAAKAGMALPIEHFAEWLIAVPALLAIVVFAVLAYVVRSWQFALVTIVGFLLVLSLEQWEAMLQLMSQVIIATLVAVIIAIPVGILAGSNKVVSAIVRPVLDFMQTMPAFVYLIPAVLFFSLGYAPGLFATVIFALPPGVRMTELGIRQVDPETVEAGESFGATPWQILRGIQLPLAVPTIMAGVNQVIMLSLSMAVIAGMVGAEGLGKEVTDAVSTQNLPQGVEAGLSVVILAVFLDRMTAALGNPKEYPSSLVGVISAARRRRATA